MRIAFWGTSSFVGSVRNAEILERLIAEGVRPTVVITTPPREPSDRAPSTASISPVRAAAEKLNILVLEPALLKNFAAELARRDIELSIVAAYGKILPADVLSVPKFGSLNIHPSLLPRWRGPTPIQATIRAGDPETGVTIILMDEKMDHGPIVAYEKWEMGNRNITAPELASELARRGARLLRDTLPDWIAGRIQPKMQVEELATYSKMLHKEDGRIDWQKPAAEIERMVRAYVPWPGAYTFWHTGKKSVRLHLEAADVLAEREDRTPPGRVLAEDGLLRIGSGKGSILVRRLKAEGSPAMDAKAFLNGHPKIIGAALD